MIELFAGIAGGLGLFIVGMWLLTENLKALASWRLRQTVIRWTANRFSALAWGTIAGAITQSLSALTFIVVGILRSGLITTQGAFALILGGTLGASVLVIVITFDIKVVSLYLVGIAGGIVATERLWRFRPIAASFLGGTLIILGLVLLKEAAAPLADEPWFREMLRGTGDSPALAFFVAAFLTFIVQSSTAVTVFGISLAAVGLLSVDQAIMTIYGSIFGSGVIIYVLSAGLRGQSRQVAMYLIGLNALVCAFLVPLLYIEIHSGIPLVKAWALSLEYGLEQQLAAVYVFLCVVPLPVMLAALGWSAAVLERLWPTSPADALSRLQFIHDHASADVETAAVLADREQRRAVRDFSVYFEAVRKGERVRPLRANTQTLLSSINEFLDEMNAVHATHRIEDQNTLRNRQKLLAWLENALGTMCETLADVKERSGIVELRTTICEGVDGVLLSLVEAMESNDPMIWKLTRTLTGDRSQLMRDIRARSLERDPPLDNNELAQVLLITNSIEETFFLFRKIGQEFGPEPDTGPV